MSNIIYINQAAIILGINPQTLRRWDETGKLPAKRNESNRLFYYANDLDDFLKANSKYLLKAAERWAYSKKPVETLDNFYCPDRSIFKARLARFEFELKNDSSLEKIYSLVVAVAGEIGNNSFDHNLGNWPDVNGIFFGYNLPNRIVVLADRGQGILTTLKRVNANLANDQEALNSAFTEIISGRAPENRGNGLKFVRKVVIDNGWELFFQTGEAVLVLNNKNNSDELMIKKSAVTLRGCYAKLIF